MFTTKGIKIRLTVTAFLVTSDKRKQQIEVLHTSLSHTKATGQSKGSA